jgi:hypothetical protein
MATVSFPEAAPAERTPPLVAGDRLTAAEFERRYRAMPHVTKAELIEGVVYMPSPVSTEDHAEPHAHLMGWLVFYKAYTPGVQCGDNATLRLDLDNRPQPDAFLRIRPEHGGHSQTAEGYVVGGPELTAEVTASSASYDLHDKLNAFRRNGVQEYIVWRVLDREIDWFRLVESRYERLSPSPSGRLESLVFPGLWLDAAALLAGDMARVLEMLQQGIHSPEHAAFVAKLAAAQPAAR